MQVRMHLTVKGLQRLAFWRICPRSEQRCARRVCAPASTCPRSRRRRRSGPSTCARWRTKSGACLPGPTFVKSFLRTYAQALGLDAQGARRGVPPAPRAPERGGARADRLDAAARARRAARRGIDQRRPRAAYMIAVGVVGVVIVLLIVLLVTRRRLARSSGQHTTSAVRHSHPPRSAPSRDGSAGAPRGERAAGDRRAVAAGRPRGVRVPDRRQRAQADPRDRTAARGNHAHLPREAL